jgi:hypothetical protein
VKSELDRVKDFGETAGAVRPRRLNGVALGGMHRKADGNVGVHLGLEGILGRKIARRPLGCKQKQNVQQSNQMSLLG